MGEAMEPDVVVAVVVEVKNETNEIRVVAVVVLIVNVFKSWGGHSKKRAHVAK